MKYCKIILVAIFLVGSNACKTVIRSEKELIDEIKMLEANFDRFSEIKHYIRQHCHNLEDKEAVKSAIKSQLMFFEEDYSDSWGTFCKITPWIGFFAAGYLWRDVRLVQIGLDNNIKILPDMRKFLESQKNAANIIAYLSGITAATTTIIYFTRCRSSLKKWRKLNYLLHSF